MSEERNRPREYGESAWDEQSIEVDEYERPRRRRHHTGEGRRQARKQRNIWPWLLLGCLGGIALLVLAAAIIVFVALRSISPSGGIVGVGSPTTYTKTDQYPVTLASIAQLTVHNTVGNVTIAVDLNAATASISSVKKVQSSSQDEANQEFQKIAVQVKQSDQSQSLSVTAMLPNQGTIFNKSGDAVDITLTLPPGIISTTALFTLNADTSFGDLTVDGLKGMLTVIDHDQGNVIVRNATLSIYSCIETGQGNITFNGTFDTTPPATPQPVCNDSSPSQDLVYKIHTGQGNLDMTLPATTNVNLRADTNVGTITSDFPNIASAITHNGNSSSVPRTPLCTTCTEVPTALLVLSVSTGDISLHKKEA